MTLIMNMVIKFEKLEPNSKKKKISFTVYFAIIISE